jgi:hypothetical protein
VGWDVPWFEKVLIPPEVSFIYISRSSKAPKRKLQTNGPVAKKAKKTSSSDSSEDSSEEEEKTQEPPAKKAGKKGQGDWSWWLHDEACVPPTWGTWLILTGTCGFVQLYLPRGPVCLSILENL